MEHTKCVFKQEYWNYEDQKILPFNCELESLENKKFCLSHHEIYLKDSNYSYNKDNVIKKLSEILCIGYYLPDIKIDRVF
jgi:hypothetical protein